MEVTVGASDRPQASTAPQWPQLRRRTPVTPVGAGGELLGEAGGAGSLGETRLRHIAIDWTLAHFSRGEADLRGQMKRAARSVPFNTGEGVGRRGKARAAAYEVALGEAKE